ncbi:CapA family protein [Actinopolymorpha alba]|uniref:CapA family protein n=1 Tax=Actinopolymorpha alba TaxID=533267 RepID=UPI00036C6C08|nr:CapA family protein [Actinopolymorpha alba]
MRHLHVRILLVVVLVAGAASAGCGKNFSAHVVPTPTPPPASAVTTVTSTPPARATKETRETRETPETGQTWETGQPVSPEATAAERPITLAFAGDIHFERHLRRLLDQPATALAPLREQLAAADLTIANLETSVTTRGRPEDKSYNFRAPRSALDALAAGGVDVVSMANNHAVDYGPVGLADSLAAKARAPLAVVGIGANAAEAFAPHLVTIRGTTIAVIGADAVVDPTTRNFSATESSAGVAASLDPQRLLAAVRQARQEADVVVVYLHWGVEREGCPTGDQRSLARALSAAGADIVAGTHAHVQLAAGQLTGTSAFVAYGLGNFVWYNRSSTETITTGVLTVTLSGRTVAKAHWAPALIGSDGLPDFAAGRQAREMRRDWVRLRSCADLSDVPEPPV